MHTIANRIRRWSRAVLLTAGATAVVVSTGCEDWLKVTNPGAIENPALENPTYIDLMVNGAIGDFQPAYSWTALWSSLFSDETRNHQGFFENGDMDRRQVSDINGTYILGVYNGIQRALFLSDSVAGRLNVLLADSVNRSLHVARLNLMSGYTRVLLGEQYCEAPIKLSGPMTPEQILAEAIAKFDQAIAVGTAARAAATGANAARIIAGADSIVNAARVGAARAALWLDNTAQAIQYASAVTQPYVSESNHGFRYVVNFVDGATFAERRRMANPFWEFVSADRWLSVSETPFQNLNDPRVPHPDTLRPALDGTLRYIPRSPNAFSTYNGTVRGANFVQTSWMRVASGLEARYIIAEAEGMNAANLAFLAERRALGATLPPPANQAEYEAVLREQRSRDFFLDGHRMGDLRRYKRNYGVDLWPTGAYFGSTTLTYGDQECWPVPLVEKLANPNWPQP